MSDQAFERLVGEKLRALPGVFTYHPPDDPATRQWKPCDFLVCAGGRYIAIECKEIVGSSFPFSRWSQQQRGFGQQINEAHGRYWLVVRYMPSKQVVAFLAAGRELLTTLHGSLKPFQGIALTRDRGFTVEPLLALDPIYPAWEPIGSDHPTDVGTTEALTSRI